MLDDTPSKAVEDAGIGMPLSGGGSVRNEGALRSIPLVARLIGHIPPGQFFRYLLVGIWNTVFGYSTYAAFTALLMPRLRFGYILAQVLSGLLNIAVAYLGYKFFVFKTKGNYLREWLRCMAVYGTGMIPGVVLLPFVVEALHYSLHLGRSAPYVAGALIMGVGVIYTFLGHKKFSFRVPEAASRDLVERVQDDAKVGSGEIL